MSFRYFILFVPLMMAVFILILAPPVSFAQSPSEQVFRSPQPVEIENLPTGAGGTPISTEEPFLSRDGRFLFFNSGEQEGHKDLYYAKRISKRWVYQEPIGPDVNTSKEVEGNPAMDRAYNFYYIDSGTEAMARKARFSPDTGNLSHIVELAGIPKRKARFFKQELYGNIGVEISADGKVLYFSRATWDLNGIFLGSFLDSDILFAVRQGDTFVFDEDKARRIMKHINTPDMEYAACISSDGLELFFTHLSIAAMKKKGKIQSQIMRATRNSVSQPFGKPVEVRAIGHRDFVEGPTLSSDGRELYYHKRKGDNFRIYKVSR